MGRFLQSMFNIFVMAKDSIAKIINIFTSEKGNIKKYTKAIKDANNHSYIVYIGMAFLIFITGLVTIFMVG